MQYWLTVIFLTLTYYICRIWIKILFKTVDYICGGKYPRFQLHKKLLVLNLLFSDSVCIEICFCYNNRIFLFHILYSQIILPKDNNN